MCIKLYSLQEANESPSLDDSGVIVSEIYVGESVVEDLSKKVQLLKSPFLYISKSMKNGGVQCDFLMFVKERYQPQADVLHRMKEWFSAG